QVRPPVEAAEEQDAARVARPVAGTEIRRIDSVVYYVHCSAAEVPPDAGRVGVADGHRPRRRTERPALEALELMPLPLDVPASQRVRLVVVVALPDLRLDVVGDDQAPAGEAAQRLGVGRPLALPQVHVMRGRVLPERLPQRPAGVRGD